MPSYSLANWCGDQMAQDPRPAWPVQTDNRQATPVPVGGEFGNARIVHDASMDHEDAGRDNEDGLPVKHMEEWRSYKPSQENYEHISQYISESTVISVENGIQVQNHRGANFGLMTDASTSALIHEHMEDQKIGTSYTNDVSRNFNNPVTQQHPRHPPDIFKIFDDNIKRNSDTRVEFPEPYHPDPHTWDDYAPGSPAGSIDVPTNIFFTPSASESPSSPPSPPPPRRISHVAVPQFPRGLGPSDYHPISRPAPRVRRPDVEIHMSMGEALQAAMNNNGALHPVSRQRISGPVSVRVSKEDGDGDSEIILLPGTPIKAPKGVYGPSPKSVVPKSTIRPVDEIEIISTSFAQPQPRVKKGKPYRLAQPQGDQGPSFPRPSPHPRKQQNNVDTHSRPKPKQPAHEDDEEYRPSAKALGKRRATSPASYSERRPQRVRSPSAVPTSFPVADKNISQESPRSPQLLAMANIIRNTGTPKPLFSEDAHSIHHAPPRGLGSSPLPPTQPTFMDNWTSISNSPGDFWAPHTSPSPSPLLPHTLSGLENAYLVPPFHREDNPYLAYLTGGISGHVDHMMGWMGGPAPASPNRWGSPSKDSSLPSPISLSRKTSEQSLPNSLSALGSNTHLTPVSVSPHRSSRVRRRPRVHDGMVYTGDIYTPGDSDADDEYLSSADEQPRKKRKSKQPSLPRWDKSADDSASEREEKSARIMAEGFEGRPLPSVQNQEFLAEAYMQVREKLLHALLGLKIRGKCTCTVCTRKRGEVYVGLRTKKLTEKPNLSWSARKKNSSDPSAPRSRLGGKNNLPPPTISGPVKYWATVYGPDGGERIGNAFVGGNNEDVVLTRPIEASPPRRATKRIFVGDVQETWDLGEIYYIHDVDPVSWRDRNNGPNERIYVGEKRWLFAGKSKRAKVTPGMASTSIPERKAAPYEEGWSSPLSSLAESGEEGTGRTGACIGEGESRQGLGPSVVQADFEMVAQADIDDFLAKGPSEEFSPDSLVDTDIARAISLSLIACGMVVQLSSS
ncbi:hypothetical protein C0991_004037 [Blastosporella zonata]|nr:hypothetical protein C0991_004037 [Blastosporella zonata]